MKIVAISDQHGYLDFQLPAADLLLHAGDICPDFGPGTQAGSAKQEAWLLGPWLDWLNEQDIAYTYAVPGNHDFVHRRTLDLFAVDRVVEHEGLRIWMSPWCNMLGGWAWTMYPHQLAGVYAGIPEGVDIIVSHQPPFGYGDKVPGYLIKPTEDEGGHVGSKELLAAINRVQPRFVICGHIHDGHGVYLHGNTLIMNVALVNEQYQRVHGPMVIEL